MLFRSEHTMFASSDIFSELYIQEYGYWAEGMPLDRYRRTLERLGAEGYLDRAAEMTVERVSQRDIRDVGESLSVIRTGTRMAASWDCSRCMKCVNGDAEYRAVYIDSVEGNPEEEPQKKGSKLQ